MQERAYIAAFSILVGMLQQMVVVGRVKTAVHVAFLKSLDREGWKTAGGTQQVPQVSGLAAPFRPVAWTASMLDRPRRR